MSLPIVNHLHLTEFKSPDKILKIMINTTRSKVKSRPHYDVAHLQPTANVPTKYQLTTPYGFRDIAWTRLCRSRSLWQGQIKIIPWWSTPTTPNWCPYQVSTSDTLWFPRYSPDKIFKLKVTTARSKVKSRSDHNIAHLHPPTNVPTTYRIPKPSVFRDIVWRRFSKSRSLWQGQIKVTARRYTPTNPNQSPYHWLPTPYRFWKPARTNFFPPLTNTHSKSFLYVLRQSRRTINLVSNTGSFIGFWAHNNYCKKWEKFNQRHVNYVTLMLNL